MLLDHLAIPQACAQLETAVDTSLTLIQTAPQSQTNMHQSKQKGIQMDHNHLEAKLQLMLLLVASFSHSSIVTQMSMEPTTIPPVLWEHLQINLTQAHPEFTIAHFLINMCQ